MGNWLADFFAVFKPRDRRRYYVVIEVAAPEGSHPTPAELERAWMKAADDVQVLGGWAYVARSHVYDSHEALIADKLTNRGAFADP